MGTATDFSELWENFKAVPTLPNFALLCERVVVSNGTLRPAASAAAPFVSERDDLLHHLRDRIDQFICLYGSSGEVEMTIHTILNACPTDDCLTRIEYVLSADESFSGRSGGTLQEVEIPAWEDEKIRVPLTKILQMRNALVCAAISSWKGGEFPRKC